MKHKIYYGIRPNGTAKIGCTTDYPNRPESQGLTDYMVLEEHDDIEIASQREIELQIQYFGKRDSTSTYANSMKARSISGKIGGRVRANQNDINHYSLMGKIGGSNNKENMSQLGKQTTSNKEHQRMAGSIAANKIRLCPNCGRELKGMAAYNTHLKFRKCFIDKIK